MKVDDCDFSAAPVWPDAEWPRDRPSGVKPTRLADWHKQKPRYVDFGLPMQSERVETDSRPNGSVRCRIIEETTVTRQIIEVYCVKTFAFLRRKLSWKKVGVGVLAVGVVASAAVPILIPVHIAAAVIAGITTGGAGATAAGGGMLALPPSGPRRDPRTEEKDTFEVTTTKPWNRVLHSKAGPWRSCRATNSTHLECVQHG